MARLNLTGGHKTKMLATIRARLDGRSTTREEPNVLDRKAKPHTKPRKVYISSRIRGILEEGPATASEISDAINEPKDRVRALVYNMRAKRKVETVGLMPRSGGKAAPRAIWALTPIGRRYARRETWAEGWKTGYINGRGSDS